eukprot:Hpha_TRINITY_DN16417_c3_g1::TRINITY_DN16417_c3_g1_i2::g.164030::m.164030/K03824/yhbS; putative acetyltransferase
MSQEQKGDDAQKFNVRLEKASDVPAIRSVVLDAFDQPGEADLVDRLRDRDQVQLSLVAEQASDGQLLGHVMVSPVSIDGIEGRFGGVAPVSVKKDSQKRGIGSALMRAAIEQSRGLGLSALVLLGDPAYYRRFGFVSSHLANEYGADDAFMHFELASGTLDGAKGAMVRYASAFAEMT